MAGLTGGPTPPPEAEDPAQAARNARVGLWLFLAYVLLYAGFMGLSAFAYRWMKQTPLGGVNLAILYGFGLILAALAIALLYMWLCQDRPPAASPNHPQQGP